MAQGPESDFGWFAAWVDQQLCLNLTFARGLTRERLLEALGVASGPAGAETFAEAGADPDWAKVRVGGHDGWVYAVEQFTFRGADHATLSRLSAAGGEAFALTYTLTISTFLYAADGELVSGFDLVAPSIRWGRDPHRFDAGMAQAGFLRPGVPEPKAMGARFVRLAFGVTLDPELLERPLPSYELGPPPAPRPPWGPPTGPGWRALGPSAAPPSSPQVPPQQTPVDPQRRGAAVRPPDD